MLARVRASGTFRSPLRVPRRGRPVAGWRERPRWVAGAACARAQPAAVRAPPRVSRHVRASGIRPRPPGGMRHLKLDRGVADRRRGIASGSGKNAPLLLDREVRALDVADSSLVAGGVVIRWSGRGHGRSRGFGRRRRREAAVLRMVYILYVYLYFLFARSLHCCTIGIEPPWNRSVTNGQVRYCGATYWC